MKRQILILALAQAALAALKLEEGDEKEEQCCVA